MMWFDVEYTQDQRHWLLPAMDWEWKFFKQYDGYYCEIENQGGSSSGANNMRYMRRPHEKNI